MVDDDTNVKYHSFSTDFRAVVERATIDLVAAAKDPTIDSFRAVAKAKMQRKNISQKDVVEGTGLDQSTISRFFGGTRAITVGQRALRSDTHANMLKIAAFLEIPESEVPAIRKVDRGASESTMTMQDPVMSALEEYPWPDGGIPSEEMARISTLLDEEAARFRGARFPRAHWIKRIESELAKGPSTPSASSRSKGRRS